MAGGENTVCQRYIRSTFLQTLWFNGRACIPNLKFIIQRIFSLLFSSILSELFFPLLICLLFTSAWIQQDKSEYTLIVCSLIWDFVESFLSSKINYCLFPCGQIFSLGICLTRLTIPWSASSFKGEAFPFLSVFTVQHDFGIWVSSVSQIMCLYSPTKKWQLVSFRSFKILPRVGFFGVYSSALIMVTGLPLSTDTYMANRKWSFLMPMSPCANREGWKETAFPLVLFLITTRVGWWPACCTSFPHNLANVWGCYISLSQYACIVCSIWHVDRTLSSATTLGQCGPGSNGYEGVIHIPQISKAGTCHQMV